MTPRIEQALAANVGPSAQWFLHSVTPGKPAVPAGLSSSTVTITIASPGVITWNAHGLAADRPIKLSTTGALPTGLTAGTTYYVANPTANTFEVASAPAGASINTSGSQSGTQTATQILNAAELAQFDVWLTKRNNGTLDVLAVSQSFLPNVQAMIALYEAYFATADYISWAHTDLVSREIQWKDLHVRIANGLAAAGTIPPSGDVSGAGTSAPAGIGVRGPLLFGRAHGIDISASAEAILYDENAVIMFDNTSGSGIYGYITDIIFSIYAPTPSTAIHEVGLLRATGVTPSWASYMPQPTSSQSVSVLPVTLKTPLWFSPGDTVKALFSLVSGSATGYKGACSVLGYVE